MWGLLAIQRGASKGDRGTFRARRGARTVRGELVSSQVGKSVVATKT